MAAGAADHRHLDGAICGRRRREQGCAMRRAGCCAGERESDLRSAAEAKGRRGCLVPRLLRDGAREASGRDCVPEICHLLGGTRRFEKRCRDDRHSRNKQS
eukprot:7386599-Pyramimonas_sp.AAC.1